MRRPWLQPLRIILTGMILAAGIGWVAFYVRLGLPLTRLSYDMMFLFRDADLATTEIQLVDIDEASGDVLDQSRSGVLSRAVHAQLVRRLTQDGARAVLFDVAFTAPSPDPAVDQDFADALKENGKVFLGAALDRDDLTSYSSVTVRKEAVRRPIPVLREAARASGTVGVIRDPDKAVRRIHAGTEAVPAATWQLARFLGADLSDDYERRNQERWLNYYGAAGTLNHVPYWQALQPNGLAPSFFKDRIVIIGGRRRLSTLQLSNDDFADPWTRWGGNFMSGAEVHANALLNLLHGTWFIRAENRTEGTFIVVVGIVVGGLLARLRPLVAAVTGVAFAIATLGGALWWLEHHRVWYNWLVPVAIQIPVAIAWSWAANSFLEARKRAEMAREAAFYLPRPVMDQIAKGKPVDSARKVVEATVIFTDLCDYTGLSETVGDPAEVSQIVNEYLSEITRHVGANHGTILRIQGDGVFASWGVPASNRNHPIDAVAAAWGICRAAQREIAGYRLLTRIGINSGLVSAGNFGSDTRVEYTLIGDPVNLASRLETLNKHLGTTALMAEATHAQLDGRYPTRCLGKFMVLGKKAAVTVHELLDPDGGFPDGAWLETFAKALAAFQDGDLDEATILFQQVHDERAIADGPTKFYLQEITRVRAAGLPSEWTGAVEMIAK